MFIDLEKDLKLIPWQFDESTTKSNSLKLNNYLATGQIDTITIPAKWFGFSDTIFVPAVAGGRLMGSGMGKDCCYTQAKTHNGNSSVFVWCGKPDSRFMTIRGAFFEIDGIHFMGNFWEHQTTSPPDWPEREKRCAVAIAFEEDPDGGTLKSWSGKNRIRASFFLFRKLFLATHAKDEYESHSDEIDFDHVIAYGVETVYSSECLQAVGSNFKHLNVYFDCEHGVSRPTTVFDIVRGGNIHVSNLTFSSHGGTVLSIGEPGKSFVGQDNGSFVFDNIKVDTGMFSLGYTKENPFRLIDMKDDVHCFVRMTGHIGHANFDTSKPWYNPNGESVVVTKGSHYNIAIDMWGLDDITAAKYPMHSKVSMPVLPPSGLGDEPVDPDFDNPLLGSQVEPMESVTPNSYTPFQKVGTLAIINKIHNKPSFYLDHRNQGCLAIENYVMYSVESFFIPFVGMQEGINPKPHGYAGIFSHGEWKSGSTNWIGGSFEALFNGGSLCVAKMVGDKYVISERTTNEVKPFQPYLAAIGFDANTGKLEMMLDGVKTIVDWDKTPTEKLISKLVLFGRNAHGKFDQTISGWVGDLSFYDFLPTKQQQENILNRLRIKYGVN